VPFLIEKIHPVRGGKMASKDLVNAIANLKENEALEISKVRLNSGDNPMTILDDARRGMEIVGERFASGEYFIPDLVYSGEILKQITDMVKPKLLLLRTAKVRLFRE
jgi:methanogenic corrinoid protein MtbC1